ncbi:MAG: gliding motility-associated C-terminal domain-containing protein [Cytophagaceae bacterium]|nr:gliding motility-associated C-terminal domain-containing protein [Cytophagaceae bacterium]
MSKMIKIWAFLIFTLFIGVKSHATHLKAGEITADRISTLEYKFTLIIYTDSLSAVDETTADLKFSDGVTLTSPRDQKIYIGNETYKNIYFFSRTFTGLGTYRVRFQRDNRNAGVLNMDNSGNTPFFIESMVKIGFGDNGNSPPALLYPPVDIAMVGQKYTHNPAAFDREGDSVSFEMTIPRQAPAINVAGYANPNIKPVTSGNFSLDPYTGDLVWDAPVVAGYYNVAFIIREWRNGREIGYIVRDMQIEVKEQDNNAPRRITPDDTCVAAGSLINKNIIAIDPDNNQIKMSSESGVYDLPAGSATFSITNPQPSPATGIFNWQTSCLHVREQPYDVIFKVEDIPASGTPLVEVRAWSIKVFGPSPDSLKVNPASGGLQLTWKPYICPNATVMEIYRKDCDSSGFIPDACTAGVPGLSGYKKIGQVPIGITSYLDTSNLLQGSFYCYMIAAAFPAPGFGKSYASEEVCADLTQGEPLPTNVSVMETDSINGKILVRWTQPLNLDVLQYPGPYKYRVLRADSLAGTNYTPVDTLFALADTMVIDSSLNTLKKAYNYKVEFYYNTSVLKGTTVSSSSVFLTATPGNGLMNLSWIYNVPWKNEGQYHRIYKETSPGVFTLLDSVFVTGSTGSYIATGLTNGDTACFYVETSGGYCKDGLPEPLLNKSQVACQVPRDITPPCPPVLFGPTACMDEGITQLTINWIPDRSAGCNKDISGYNVYYSEYEDEEMVLLASGVADTFLIDTDNFSLAGCYAVTALNYYSIESAMSNKVCVDICVYYDLPNLISPNKDNLNDVFKPFPVPKNVEQVKFSVYNRWGKRVYYSDNDIHLNWPGVASDGSVLAAGIYYFNAEVKFKRRLKKDDEVKVIKGWVHIVRKEDEPATE